MNHRVPGGAGCVGQVNAGVSRGAVLAALSQSAEFRADAADPAFLTPQ